MSTTFNQPRIPLNAHFYPVCFNIFCIIIRLTICTIKVNRPTFITGQHLPELSIPPSINGISFSPNQQTTFRFVSDSMCLS